MRQCVSVRILALVLATTVASAAVAQRSQDFVPQFHGYATQSLIYSDVNNWNLTNSTDTSIAWSEAVLSATLQPNSRLRLGAQGRFFLLGSYSKKALFDWALVEYKFNERFGLRGGKVKTPSGLLNEAQDIGPAHLWILLPQSVYPLASRTAVLSHYGGVVFGSIPLGENFGKLEYRAYGGRRMIPSDDGYLEPFAIYKVTVPGGASGVTAGGRLSWRTPLAGLSLGVADGVESPGGKLVWKSSPGKFSSEALAYPFFFAQFEHHKLMVAGEYNRHPLNANFTFDAYPASKYSVDHRNFYVMTSYKISKGLTAGAYYSSAIDRRAPYTAARYQKDWTISGRYELNSFLYMKAEQHFLDGTLIGYSALNNPSGLAETSHLSLFKLGVSF